MTRRIAIIPARGGSKRISDKNIRNFCGKPMISYILNVAKKSELFDIIHVSTDSKRIAETVSELGFSIDFMRPKELADDFTPIMPVLKCVTEKYSSLGQNFDEIWLLMACSPLIEYIDLQQAAKQYKEDPTIRPMLAISEYPVPIEWAFNWESDGEMTPVQPGMFAIRSQDIGKKYFDAGVFSVFSSSHVISAEGAGTDTGFTGYIIQKSKAVDIDEQADWDFAEALYRMRVTS